MAPDTKWLVINQIEGRNVISGECDTKADAIAEAEAYAKNTGRSYVIARIIGRTRAADRPVEWEWESD